QPDDDERTGCKHDRGEDRTVEKHDRHEDQDRCRIEDGAEQLAHQEGADLPYLMSLMGHPTNLRALEEIDGQIQQPVEKVGGELDVHARCQMNNQKLAHAGQNRLEGHEDDHGETKHKERVVGLEIKDFVSEKPPEDDRRQRQEAQKERAQGDVANNPAFTENQRCYETYAERLTLVRDLVVAVDENDFASPGVFESDAINDKQCVTAAIGILKHHASLVIFAIHPKQYHAAAMPEYDDCGQRLLKRRERTP